MIALLSGWLVKKGAGKAAKPLAWTIIILAAVALFWGAKAAYDASVISSNDAKVEASAQREGRAADAKAAEQRSEDQTRLHNEADELRKVTSDGLPSTAPQAPLDDARRAYHRCVRLQQAARANGERPPPCS
jgi:hypothetical protein